MEGWIKLHRKMLDNPVVFKDSDHVAVWMWLLLHAEHKNVNKLFSGKKVELVPGQLITTQLYIAKSLGISSTKVKRVLDSFKSDEQIDYQTNNKNTLISLLNWSSYQTSDEQSGEQVVNNRRTSGEQVVTNKNIRIEEYNNIYNMCDSKIESAQVDVDPVTESEIEIDSKPESEPEPEQKSEQSAVDKRNENIKAANELFERLWKQYPEKKGKGQVSDTAKLRLLKVGEEQMQRAIKRYLDELDKDDWRRPQNGSTFFNSGYVDYLDGNFTPSKKTESKRYDPRGFDQRIYNDAELEEMFMQELNGFSQQCDDG